MATAAAWAMPEWCSKSILPLASVVFLG
jgi:hypothetical protein